MNREELEDLKITKISEEEYERLKDSDEGEAMEVSIDSLKAEQEKLKESASLLDEAKKAFSAYWFLLSLFIGQNLCLGVVLCQIYSAWSKGEPPRIYGTMCHINNSGCFIFMECNKTISRTI